MTGSIFSGFQNNHESKLPFSPYGLSKKIQSEIFHLYGDILGLDVRTFVIPNPFGALTTVKWLLSFGTVAQQQNGSGIYPRLYSRQHSCGTTSTGLRKLDSILFQSRHSRCVFCPSGYQMSVKDFVSHFATSDASKTTSSL